MNPAGRSQLWLATLGAVVSLGAAAIPATIELLGEDSPSTAVAPVDNVTAPVVSPTTTPAPAEPTTGGQGESEGGGGGERRGGRGGGGGP